jgi:hypothetical protein
MLTPLLRIRWIGLNWRTRSTVHNALAAAGRIPAVTKLRHGNTCLFVKPVAIARSRAIASQARHTQHTYFSATVAPATEVAPGPATASVTRTYVPGIASSGTIALTCVTPVTNSGAWPA